MNEMNAEEIMKICIDHDARPIVSAAGTSIDFPVGEPASINIPMFSREYIGNMASAAHIFADRIATQGIMNAINGTSANDILGVDENTKNVVKFEDGRVKSTTILNENVRHENANVMPDITNVEFVENEGAVKVVIVHFADGMTEKAVLADDDEYSVEYALTVCIAKKLLSQKTYGAGGAVYNKIIHHALKGIKTRNAETEKAIKEAQAREARFEKMKQKKAAKKAKRDAAEREEKVAIQSDAILRAMKQFVADGGKKGTLSKFF